LGHSVTQHKNVSEVTANLIDQEVRRLIDTAEGEARRILTKHRDELETVTQALLEYETLSGAEVRDLIAGKGVHRPEPDDMPTSGGAKTSVPSSGKGKEKKDSPGLGAEPVPEA
jgi:cell division protease FtsH